MLPRTSDLTQSRDRLIASIRARSAGAGCVVVAIDGRSGTGKSTLAEAVASVLDAVIVPCDDFYSANVTDAEWDGYTPAERAEHALDWRRLRHEAIEPLRSGRSARWQAFDLAAGTRPDGTYARCTTPTERTPKAVIVLDGAYTARPELTDVVDLTVLVEAPAHTRAARLAARESPDFLARWHARWTPAEEHYFGRVRPAASFDLVLRTGGVPAKPVERDPLQSGK